MTVCLVNKFVLIQSKLVIMNTATRVFGFAPTALSAALAAFALALTSGCAQETITPASSPASLYPASGPVSPPPAGGSANLSPAASDVVQMAQSAVSDDVPAGLRAEFAGPV